MDWIQADLEKTVGIIVFILWVIFSAQEKKRKKRLEEMKKRAAKPKKEAPSPASVSPSQSRPLESKPLKSKPTTAAPRPLHQENRPLEEAEKAAKRASRAPEATRGSDLEVRVEDLIRILHQPPPAESHWTDEEFEYLQNERKRLTEENKKLKVELLRAEQLIRSLEQTGDRAQSSVSRLQSSAFFQGLAFDLRRTVVEAEILAKPLALRRSDHLRKWI